MQQLEPKEQNGSNRMAERLEPDGSDCSRLDNGLAVVNQEAGQNVLGPQPGD